MYIKRNLPIRMVILLAWKHVLFFAVYSTAIVCAFKYLNWQFLTIPFLPISLIGTAVAFYIGFKNNSAYDRQWEARKIWGSIVNVSRTWGMQVLNFVNNEKNASFGDLEIEAKHRELLYRHIAYVNALRLQLRRPAFWERGYPATRVMVAEQESFDMGSLEHELEDYIGAEAHGYINKRNPAREILLHQSRQLQALHNAGVTDTFQHVEMMRTLSMIIDQQGAAERIKGFPFPRQYAFYSHLFVWLFILLLPFGLITELGKMGRDFIWLVIPLHVLVSWVFNMIEIIGGSSENPFENTTHDIPITALCQTIEIDLKEMLAEDNLPQSLEAQNNILM